MSLLNPFNWDFVFTRADLKAGVLVSLLSVWVLVGLFYYLNRYTKRRYFTIWTAAWLFYALWITLSFEVQGREAKPLLLMLEQWCVGVSAVFLLWGSLSFLGQQVRASLLGWFMTFLLLWSYLGAYHLKPLEMEVPAFTLIAVASLVTAMSFFKYRREHPFIGATLLTMGFFLWGVFMAGYPFLETSEDLTSLALFISAGLQLMLAVSMIILVLEEVRETHELTLQEVKTGKAEREALQSKVISTEERYRTLFDQAGEAILITTTDDFRILEVNQAALRLLGASREEAGRQCLTTFCQVNHSGEKPATGEEWFRLLCRQRPLNLVRKDGAMVPLEVTGSQVEFDGRPAYQFFMLEMTERARLEQQLRQAEKLSALGQMISGVAHELNNPLAVIKGYLELILNHHDLPPNTRADLEKVAQESNRAAKLVMNFLSFAREQPGAHRDLVNLNDLAQQLVELRKFDLLVARAEIQLDLEAGLPLISADRDQAQQLIVNLVNNALQAMVELPRPGRLKISTRTADGLVRLRVEDNGPGVPPALVSKIFEPFFTTKEVGTGTGLGLSLAHSIMTEHSGRIYYEPSSLGGAGFVLEFPSAKASAGAAVSGGTTFVIKPEENAAACEGRILVLDDEKAIAEMLSEMLQLLGYTTVVCNSATQALAIIREQDFDAIISDFRMPGVNGEEFYLETTKLKSALARRIIFLTGDVVNEETMKFLKSVGNPHMGKPFVLAQVNHTVKEVIRSQAAELAPAGEIQKT